MSWPQVGALRTHSRVLALMALTQFFLDPTFCLCCLLWLLVKKSEKISRIFECAEVFHFALEQQLIAVTSVPPCQKGRSLMLPKFLQQLKHLPSLPICQLFKTFPTIREDERRETWLLAFPLQDLFFFFVFSRIIWKYSSTNDRKFEFGFLHIVKVREGLCFCNHKQDKNRKTGFERNKDYIFTFCVVLVSIDIAGL